MLISTRLVYVSRGLCEPRRVSRPHRKCRKTIDEFSWRVNDLKYLLDEKKSRHKLIDQHRSLVLPFKMLAKDAYTRNKRRRVVNATRRRRLDPKKQPASTAPFLSRTRRKFYHGSVGVLRFASHNASVHEYRGTKYI